MLLLLLLVRERYSLEEELSMLMVVSLVDSVEGFIVEFFFFCVQDVELLRLKMVNFYERIMGCFERL